MVIQGVSSSVTEVGKLLKKSKRRFTWNILVDGDPHCVEMIASHISRKRKVLLDGDIIFEATKVKDRKIQQAFHYNFQIDVNVCNIVQKGEHFDLIINNMTFEELCDNKETEFVFGPRTKAPPKTHAYVEDTQPMPTASQIVKAQIGDLGGLRGVRTKHEEAKENKDPVVNAEKPKANAQKPQAPAAQAPLKQESKKEQTQPTHTTAQTIKEKINEVGAKIKPNGKAAKEEKASKNAEKSKVAAQQAQVAAPNVETEPENTSNQPEPEIQPQPVPLLAQVYKEGLGDLSGLRGVRTKQVETQQDPRTFVPQAQVSQDNKKDQTKAQTMTQTVKEKLGEFGAKVKKATNKNDKPNKEATKAEKTNESAVETQVSQEVKEENKASGFRPPTLAQLYKEDFGDLSSLRGVRKGKESDNNKDSEDKKPYSVGITYSQSPYMQSHTGIVAEEEEDDYSRENNTYNNHTNYNDNASSAQTYEPYAEGRQYQQESDTYGYNDTAAPSSQMYGGYAETDQYQQEKSSYAASTSYSQPYADTNQYNNTNNHPYNAPVPSSQAYTSSYTEKTQYKPENNYNAPVSYSQQQTQYAGTYQVNKENNPYNANVVSPQPSAQKNAFAAPPSVSQTARENQYMQPKAPVQNNFNQFDFNKQGQTYQNPQQTSTVQNNFQLTPQKANTVQNNPQQFGFNNQAPAHQNPPQQSINSFNQVGFNNQAAQEKPKEPDFDWDYAGFGTYKNNSAATNNFNQMGTSANVAKNQAANSFSASFNFPNNNNNNQANFNNFNNWNNNGFGNQSQAVNNNFASFNNFNAGGFNQNNWAPNKQSFTQSSTQFESLI